MSQRQQAYLFLLINVICWGAALPIVKNSYDHVSAIRFLFYRFVLAAFLSLPVIIYYFRHIKLGKMKIVITVFLVELIGSVLGLTLLYEGLERGSSIQTNLLASTTPIFVIVAGIIFLKERQEKNERLGLLLAFTATIVLTLIPFVQIGDDTMQFTMIGTLLIIAQNMVTALYFVLAKKYYIGIPKLFATSISFYVGTLAFFLLASMETGGVPEFIAQAQRDLEHATVIFAAVYMATFGSIIALTLYILAQSKIEISEASLFYYLQPAIFIPLGIILNGESINFFQLGALAVVIIGVYIASSRIPQPDPKHKTKGVRKFKINQ